VIRRSPWRALVCALASVALGCPDVTPAELTRLVHLDPRLADGAAPLEFLRSQAVALERFRDFEGGDGAWRVERGSAERSDDGYRLIPDGPRPVRVVFQSEIPSERVDTIELELAVASDAVLRLVWDRVIGGKTVTRTLQRRVAGGPGSQLVRFQLERRQGWAGRVRDLWLDIPARATPQLSLQEIRLIGTGFSQGGAHRDAGQADMGLVPIGRDARRTWPAAVGTELRQVVRLPAGAVKLDTSIGLSPRSASVPDASARSSDGQVEVEIVVTPSGQPSTTVASRRIDARAGWQRVSADLSRWSDREITIHWRSTWQHAAAVPPVVLWAEPRLSSAAVEGPPPHLLLVTLDTLRADHVGDRIETPALAALADRGLYFDNAFSTSNATTPSHASILTGLHVEEHAAHSNRSSLPEANLTLAERLRARGYRTVAAVSVNHLGLGAGFGQGFDRFSLPTAPDADDGAGTLSALVTTLREWQGESAAPTFAWLHLFDPHVPYGAPAHFAPSYIERQRAHDLPLPQPVVDPPNFPAFPGQGPSLDWIRGITNRRHVEVMYRAGVAYADHLFGLLWDELEALGWADHTAVVVTSDHGESLGEHDVWYDHGGLWDPSLRVPLLVSAPGGVGGTRVSATVSTVDVAPTLLALAGVDDPALEGRDLVEIAREGGDRDRRVWFTYASLKQVGVRDGHHHYIETLEPIRMQLREGRDHGGRRAPVRSGFARGEVALYDSADAAQEIDLAEERPHVVDRYRALVHEWRERHRGLSEQRREISQEEEARLRTLGYVE